jgi:hypothetical protein
MISITKSSNHIMIRINHLFMKTRLSYGFLRGFFYGAVYFPVRKWTTIFHRLCSLGYGCYVWLSIFRDIIFLELGTLNVTNDGEFWLQFDVDAFSTCVDILNIHLWRCHRYCWGAANLRLRLGTLSREVSAFVVPNLPWHRSSILSSFIHSLLIKQG